MLNNFHRPPPRKKGRLRDNVEKYSTVGQPTDGSIIRPREDAIWVPDS